MNLRCFCNIIYSTVSCVKTIYFTTTMCCRSILGQNPEEEEKVAENTGSRNKTWKIGKTSILCSLFHAEHHHGLLWSGKELKEAEKTVPIKYNQEQGEWWSDYSRGGIGSQCCSPRNPKMEHPRVKPQKSWLCGRTSLGSAYQPCPYVLTSYSSSGVT